MKNNTIELAVEFDAQGYPTSYNTYVTRPNKITFMLVYECLSFLADLNDMPTSTEVYQMIDLVCRIYDHQFSSSQLMDGLDSHLGTFILYEQIQFIGSGNSIDGEASTEVKNTEGPRTWKDAKENMKGVYQDMAKQEGSDINSILNLPFYFVFDELNKDVQKKNYKESMLDAFT